MLELSMTQNTSQTSEAKRKPGQDRAGKDAQENDASFENEYNAVKQNDDKSVKSSEQPAEDGPQASTENAVENQNAVSSEEVDETADPELFGAADNEDESGTKIAPLALDNKSPKELSKQPKDGDVFQQAPARGSLTETTKLPQRIEGREGKTDKSAVPIEIATTTEPEVPKKPVTPNTLSPAETVIVSKALKNAAVPLQAVDRKPDGRVSPAPDQQANTLSSDGVQKLGGDAQVAAVVHPSRSVETLAEKRTRRMDAVPLPHSASMTASANITRQQNVLTPTNIAQIKPLTVVENTESRISNVFDLDAGTHWDARSTTQSTAQTLAQTLARAETPAMIGRQMADALQRLPDRPVEISLNPRELGRVRMNISAVEAGITVSVMAERPETLDLMRRNIDQLASEFQSLGYETVDFAFSQGEARQEFDQQMSENDDTSTSQLDLTSVEETPVTAQQSVPSTGIDIRL